MKGDKGGKFGDESDSGLIPEDEGLDDTVCG